MSRTCVHAQVRYTLGCYYLVSGDFRQALQQLSKTQQLLEGEHDCRTVDRAELQGYVEACTSVLQGLGQREGGSGGGELESLSSVCLLEHRLRAKDYEVMHSCVCLKLVQASLHRAH